MGGMLVPSAQAGPLLEAELARAEVLLRTGDPVHSLALLGRLKVTLCFVHVGVCGAVCMFKVCFVCVDVCVMPMPGNALFYISIAVFWMYVHVCIGSTCLP
jgi:hypothetical protein